MAQHDKNPPAYQDLESKVEALGIIVQKIGEAISEYTTESTGAIAHNSTLIPDTVPDVSLAVFAQKLYLSRREMMNRSGSPELFHEPAWDILLDLFIAQARDKHISVTDAALAGQVPTTTALRWVWSLEKTGLVKRQPDASDKRRSFVMLTHTGLTFMRTSLISMSNKMKPPLFST